MIGRTLRQIGKSIIRRPTRVIENLVRKVYAQKKTVLKQGAEP